MTRPGLRLWIGLAALIVLTPLGILARRTAWGEWTGEEIKRMLGYVPERLAGLEHAWPAPFSGYSLHGAAGSAGDYLLSALIGSAAVILVSFVLWRALR